MANGAALDIDVILKVCVWRLTGALFAVLLPLGNPGVLGLTHLIVRKQLRRLRDLPELAAAEAELTGLLERVSRLEPGMAELELAAEIVEAATKLNLPLDRGEAQIAAILILRGLPVMVTGDKRAIVGLGAALADIGRTAACDGRLACLEQLLLAMVELIGAAEVRNGISIWASGDKSASICFSYCRDGFTESSAVEGLSSYIRSVRERSGALLCVGIHELVRAREGTAARTSSLGLGGFDDRDAEFNA